MALCQGIIRRFDPVTWKADVQLVGAPTALLASVPVAANLGPNLLAPGSRVWLSPPGASHPAGAVVAPCGGPPVPWVTSRLWKPAMVTARLAGTAACSSDSFVAVPGLALTLAFEVESTVLLLLVATAYLAVAGSSYSVGFCHDDAHELTQLAPAAVVGGAEAAALEWRPLACLALQQAIAPGSHTFTLRHCVAEGEAVLAAAVVVAMAMAA